MSAKPHFTTRRGFIAALGFGAVSLYGLWAAYGAAPLPFARLASGVRDAHAGGHGGHGDAGHGPSPEEFNRLTAEFIERYRLPDGTVYPRILAGPETAGHGDAHAGHDRDHGGTDRGTMDHGAMDHGAMDHGAMDHGAMDHGAMDHGAMDHGAMDHGGMDHGAIDHGAMDHGAMDHGAMDHGAMDHGAMDRGAMDHGDADHADHDAPHAQDGAPLDVYLAAGMWYYLPATLRLDAGRPYRFRMMALDVSHGASIQFGKGGRMVRLRPGRLSEMEITFHRKGRLLVYCTFYCGPAHDYMQATIEVV
jgi:cytochrome c oxidase subunit II